MLQKVISLLILVVIVFSASGLAQDKPSKMELRWAFIMGWQFYDVENGKWKNVGLFGSDIRRFVSDYEEARKVIDEATWVSVGFYVAGIAGGVLTAVDQTCAEANGVRLCRSGPLALIGGLLSGASGLVKQFVQGPYYNKAADIYNEANGLALAK